MIIRKLLGALILGSLAAALVATLAYESGFWQAIGLIAFAVAVTALMVLGLKLITE